MMFMEVLSLKVTLSGDPYDIRICDIEPTWVSAVEE
jgi:hypothetical protein